MRRGKISQSPGWPGIQKRCAHWVCYNHPVASLWWVGHHLGIADLSGERQRPRRTNPLPWGPILFLHGSFSFSSREGRRGLAAPLEGARNRRGTPSTSEEKDAPEV